MLGVLVSPYLLSAKGAKKTTANSISENERKPLGGEATKTKTKSVIAKPMGKPEALLRAHGTSSAEIQSMIQSASQARPLYRSMTGEEVKWQVSSAGGGFSSSTDFVLASVVAQTAVGVSSSADFMLNSGFLQNFSGPGCCDTPGDFTDDGSFNIADVTAGIARIFGGGPPPACADESDFNSDGTFNIADVTAGIARIFAGGPAPVCGTTGG